MSGYIFWLTLGCSSTDDVQEQSSASPNQELEASSGPEKSSRARENVVPSNGSNPANSDAQSALVDVILQSYSVGPQLGAKGKLIRVVREITGLGIKDGKALVESAPALIRKGVTPFEAAEIKQKLEARGATVVLKQVGESADLKQAGDESKASVKVVLQAYPPKDKVKVISVIRELTGGGLLESKKLSERCPVVLFERATSSEAENAKQKLEALGATVIVQSID